MPAIDGRAKKGMLSLLSFAVLSLRRRNRRRTLLTVLAVACATVVFCTVMVLPYVTDRIATSMDTSPRLVVINRTAMRWGLPESYSQKIANLPDVVAVNRDWGTIPDNTTTYKILQGMLFEISPNAVTAIVRMFSNTAADGLTGTQRTYYEKVFVVNNNTGTALSGAQIEIATEMPSLPSGALLDLTLTTALNDTGTVASRQVAPSSGIGSFITQPAFVSVPGPGNLPSGATPNASGAQGMWLRLTLPAGTAAYKGWGDLRTQGTTT